MINYYDTLYGVVKVQFFSNERQKKWIATLLKPTVFFDKIFLSKNINYEDFFEEHERIENAKGMLYNQILKKMSDVVITDNILKYGSFLIENYDKRENYK